MKRIYLIAIFAGLFLHFVVLSYLVKENTSRQLCQRVASFLIGALVSLVLRDSRKEPS